MGGALGKRKKKNVGRVGRMAGDRVLGRGG